MSLRSIVDLIVLPSVWAALIFGALKLQAVVGEPTVSVCGPWGCGPETSSLLAMHLGWLAALAPPFLYLPFRLNLSRRAIRWLVLGMFATSLTAVLGVVAWQWLVWMPQAGEWGPKYFWQRCGFVISIAVDYPMVQLSIIALGIAFVNRLRPTLLRG